MARSYGHNLWTLFCRFSGVVMTLKFFFVFWPVRFVRVEQLKEKLLKSNEQTEWVPGYVKVGRRKDQYSEYILLVRFVKFLIWIHFFD